MSGAEEDDGAGVEHVDSGGGKLFFQGRVLGAWIENDARGLGGNEVVGHAGGVGRGDVHRDGVKRLGNVREALEGRMTFDAGEGGMDGENGVAHFREENDGLVAIAFGFVAGAENRDVHGVAPVSLWGGAAARLEMKCRELLPSAM